MSHAGLPVQGYQPQSDEKVGTVNINKTLEELILRQLDRLQSDPDTDKRWVAIARTQLEQGFMAMNRSVFKPGRAPVDFSHLDTFYDLISKEGENRP
jgi:hypothetical protein